MLDAHVPTHGNRQGLSLGWVCTIWLAHILSQADHRLNQVRPWADLLQDTLTAFLPAPLRPTDLTDDRLVDAVRILRDAARWAAYEGALNGPLVRGSDLRLATVRVDSATASGPWDVTPDGLFPFGHRKAHRPDLPQGTVMLATRDPLGLPVAADVVAGQRADAPLYRPIIARVRASLGQSGRVDVGDCKLGARTNRATLHRAGEYSLCPLGAMPLPTATVAERVETVLTSAAVLTPITRRGTDGHPQIIADAIEQTIPVTTTLAGQVVTGPERHVLVRSRATATAQARALQQRLGQAETEVPALLVARRGTRRPTTPDALDAAVTTILQRYGVEGILTVTTKVTTHTRTRRASHDRPAESVTPEALTLTTAIDADAQAAAQARLGWRVDVTNCPADEVHLTQVVLAYRDP